MEASLEPNGVMHFARSNQHSMGHRSSSSEAASSHDENNSDDERELFRIFSGLHVLSVSSEINRNSSL